MSCIKGLALCLAVTLVACQSKVNQEPLEQVDFAGEMAWDIEMLYSDSIKTSVRVTAPLLQRIDQRGKRLEKFSNGFKAEFYDANGRVQSTLTSQEAIRNPDEKVMVVQQDVVLVDAAGKKLETSELTWDEKTQLVKTNRFVKITTPKNVLYGYGLEATQDFTWYRFMKTTGRVNVESTDGKPQILKD